MSNVSYSHYTTKAKFLEDLNLNAIPSGAIVFIQETGEIYTHGHLYNSLSEAYEVKDGDVAKGDTIEEAIGKLDKQVKAATSAAGVKSVSTKGTLLKAITDATGAVLIESNDDTFTSALADKLDASEVGVTVPALDSDGLIESKYLPSYVDDVLEYTTYSELPSEGEDGKIYVTTDDNKTYRWSGTTYVEIGSSLALGETSSTAYAGDKGKAVRDDVDSILDGDKELVTPVIYNPEWKVYMNDGTTLVETKNSASITLHKGYKAIFSGYWKWTSVSSKKDPETTSGNWGTSLPASDESSSILTGTLVSSNTSYTQKVQASKKGLMVSGTKVVRATGSDEKSCTASVSFTDQIFYGVIDSTDATGSDVTADKIQAVTSKDQNSKSATINVNAFDSTKRLVFAYPASYGTLSSIKKDGVESVISAFTLKTVSIDNGTGAAAISYNVYYSGTGAVTSNSSFSFA